MYMFCWAGIALLYFCNITLIKLTYFINLIPSVMAIPLITLWSQSRCVITMHACQCRHSLPDAMIWKDMQNTLVI